MRGEGYSLSDIAAATGNGNGGFGNNGDWAWILILLVLFGWGRNGFGNGGSDNSGAYPNYVLTSDFSQLSRQISDSTNMLERRTDNIINGICDLGYTTQSLINGVNTNILTTSNNTNMAISGLGTQLGNCCCELKSQIADNKYEMAKGFCSTNNTIAMSARDIVDNMNANYRALHDEIVANRIEDKNAQITAQQNEINALRLAASQEKQNAYLLSELKPCPKASYIVPNPNCCYNYTVSQGCGCNGGY